MWLDSSSSIVVAILTRKGRELIAKNNGEFRITHYSFGDDEINYQLYNAQTDSDTDILNLPILEPSSNELTALRYRLVTLPQGSISTGYIVANPDSLTLKNSNSFNNNIPSTGIITLEMKEAPESGYTVTTRDNRIAVVVTPKVSLLPMSTPPIAQIQITGGVLDGSTFIDVVGINSGIIISIPITTIS